MQDNNSYDIIVITQTYLKRRSVVNFVDDLIKHR